VSPQPKAVFGSLASLGFHFSTVQQINNDRRMIWVIEEISISSSKVYLKEVDSGVERVISVPDALDAMMVGESLFIRSASHLWEVNPTDGFRKRITVAQAPREIIEIFAMN
jgi:hypothetical protein